MLDNLIIKNLEEFKKIGIISTNFNFSDIEEFKKNLDNSYIIKENNNKIGIEFIKTIFTIYGVITINLYQNSYSIIKNLNNNYYLEIYDFLSDRYYILKINN